MHYGQNGGRKSWKSDTGELEGAQAPQHEGNSWKDDNSLKKVYTCVETESDYIKKEEEKKTKPQEQHEMSKAWIIWFRLKETVILPLCVM